ncbi:MAG: hypothetical protein ABEK50_16035 [bacterium]
MPKNKTASVCLSVLLLAELVRGPMKIRKLPRVESLNEVRKKISSEALVPVPFSSWATEVQFGQTIHRKKFHLAGLSYIPDDVWGPISKNPFLDSLYQGEPLPDSGIKSLREQGVGGIIVHYRILEEARRKQLTNRFKKLFGDPSYETDRFRLYTFESPGMSSSRNFEKSR